jgi:hypothetical protein
MVDEVELAWALATTAAPHLSTGERHDVYIAIAVGDTFPAIGALIATVVREQLALPADLISRFTRLLDAYAGHDDEPRLRALIARVQTHHPG